jgi:metal-responsive CopG/Arc/MetJ family transcriptional regulator
VTTTPNRRNPPIRWRFTRITLDLPDSLLADIDRLRSGCTRNGMIKELLWNAVQERKARRTARRRRTDAISDPMTRSAPRDH